MNKYLIFVILITTPANAVSLLVQTENGQVSIIKDLKDMKQCKIAACKLKQSVPCSGTCNEEGEMSYKNMPNGCGYNVSGSYVKLVECLE